MREYFLNLGQKNDITKMYLIHAPFFLRWYYPEVVFNRSRGEKKIHLTFDDGPVPEATPFALDTLARYGIRATFFCVGENIRRHPDIFERLKEEGHRIGNHTFSHLNGWKTEDGEYMENVSLCQDLVGGNLFRPPYGRVKKSQLRWLRKTHEIVFWDVLSGDFDRSISPEKCCENVIRHAKNGSIIVFHDSLKALPRMRYALPRSIEHLLAKGYAFEVL